MSTLNTSILKSNFYCEYANIYSYFIINMYVISLSYTLDVVCVVSKICFFIQGEKEEVADC